jgi:RecJ-like exonuclease
MLANLRTCWACGTRLRIEGCRRCDGTGKTRSWIFRRRCPVCRGTGQITLCPNWVMHVSSVPQQSAKSDEQHRQEMIKRGSAYELMDDQGRVRYSTEGFCESRPGPVSSQSGDETGIAVKMTIPVSGRLVMQHRTMGSRARRGNHARDRFGARSRMTAASQSLS